MYIAFEHNFQFVYCSETPLNIFFQDNVYYYIRECKEEEIDLTDINSEYTNITDSIDEEIIYLENKKRRLIKIKELDYLKTIEEKEKKLGIVRKINVREMERCVRSCVTPPFEKNKGFLKRSKPY